MTTRKGQPLPSRRSLLKAASAAGAISLAPRLLRRTQGAAFAAAGPEVSDMTFGIVALTDCSPIVIAHEKGLFRKHGIASSIIKPANWAAARDALVKGDVQATHLLLGMPIASSMGLGGQPAAQVVIPWLLNRNGQAITLTNELKGKVGADPKALKPHVDEAKRSGARLTFAMTFPPGTHAMWLRYYLGAGGINPDRDVELVTVPPPQMVQNMRVGKMDGFCVGEPWNARAVAERVGFTAITSQEIWKDHPEKACAFRADFAERNPRAVKAALKALNEASVWLDDLGNRQEQCQILSRDAYLKCRPELILGRLRGRYDYGDGRKTNDPNYMIFSARNCNYPQPSHAKWWVTQFRRWGMVGGTPDYEGVAARVMRPDLYEEAMREVGHAHAGRNDEPWTMFDGVRFDPRGDLDAYARGFAVNSAKG